MPDEIAPPRDDVAALRAELQGLRRDHTQLLRRVGISPEGKDEPWSAYLHIEATCLALRDDPQ